MIAVTVVLSHEGTIRELQCSGHAGFSLGGTDIVCSAFTILLRTWVRTCEGSSEVGFQVLTDAPGLFHQRVDAVAPAAVESYRGSCWFFLRGLDDLSKDFPRQVTITYQKASGRF